MRTAALLAALLVAVGPSIAIAGNHEPPSDWRAKADEPLLQALAEGQGTLTLQVVGPVLADPAVAPATRDGWRAHWAAHSAPFLGSLRAQVERLGGTVTSEVPAVNAAFVRIGSERVPDLLARADVRLGALDWMGATYVLGGEGPGIAVDLKDTIAKVQAQEMWALGYRGEGVRMAAIDTGIRGTHEMLKNADGTSRVVGWYDATGPAGKCANPCDTHGHGTHVTTTSAGSNLFNTNSPQGVAPRTTIIGVRIFQGGGGTWEDAQEGLQGAFDLNADITTNSWGGGCSGGGVTTAELAESLQKAGMQNVFASGNSGGGGHICPGMVDNVVSVGAIDINEVIAGFSSRGPCTWPVGSGNSRICPDVVAVGVNVNAGCQSSDTCYTQMSGTSMATPHVAGVVVLLQQAKIALKGTGMSAKDKEAEILMRYTAKDLGTPGPDNDYGWGLAKAKNAYDVLANPAALNLKDLFSNGKAEIRSYETNTLMFSLANLGSVALNGRLNHKVEQIDWAPCPPTCDSVVIADRDVPLGSIREVVSTYSFSGDQHPAGTYKVTASYKFSYTDPADGLTKSGEVSREAIFVVKKVAWMKVRAIPGESHPGDLILGGLVLRNVGNENATAVQFTEFFNPRGHIPAPVAPPGVGPYGAFANPAPDSVNLVRRIDLTQAQYVWKLGEVKYGTQWEAKYNFVAGAPNGVAVATQPPAPRVNQVVTPPVYTFTGVLSYADETGRGFIDNFIQDALVTLPVSPP